MADWRIAISAGKLGLKGLLSGEGVCGGGAAWVPAASGGAQVKGLSSMRSSYIALKSLFTLAAMRGLVKAFSSATVCMRI